MNGVGPVVLKSNALGCDLYDQRDRQTDRHTDREQRVRIKTENFELFLYGLKLKSNLKHVFVTDIGDLFIRFGGQGL